MSTVNQRIRDLVSEIKNTLGFSIELISKQSGIKYSRLTNIMYDRTDAKESDFEAIQKVLDVSKKPEVDQLIAENEALKKQLWEAMKDKEFQQKTIDKLLGILGENNTTKKD